MSAEPAKAATTHWVVWLFAGIGLLGIIAIILLAAIATTAFDPPPEAKVAEREGGTVYTVGDAQNLRGTDFVQLVISASEAQSSGSYSYSREDRRNILLLDRRTGATRRLLPDNRRRIGNIIYLSARGDLLNQQEEALMGTGGEDAADKESAPLAYYVLQVRAGAEDEDLYQVIVGRLGDGAQAVVMAGVEGVDSMWMHTPHRIGMLVREKLALHYRIVDVATLKVVHSRRVDIG
jgi:hypothetical protein